MINIILLLIGFALLIKGADAFVEGAASIARKFNVPSMIIGLTIVAMGTSAPEAAVSIASSLAGQNDMSIANVVGSNLFNLLGVLGASAMIAKLPIAKKDLNSTGVLLLVVSVLLAILSVNGNISRIDGIILLVFFVIFLVNTIKGAKNKESEPAEVEVLSEVAIAEEVEVKFESGIKTALFIVFGALGIVFGGDMVVDAASAIGKSFGMSENLVGMTIVALGTSLPEFVTSLTAIKKGETEMAIGNVLGSNLFNILFVLGLAATIMPLSVSAVAMIDLVVVAIVTLMTFVCMKKDYSLNKKHGIAFIVIYAVYMIYTIIR